MASGLDIAPTILAALDSAATVGRWGTLMANGVRALRKVDIWGRLVVEQMARVGVDSVPIALFISAFTYAPWSSNNLTNSLLPLSSARYNIGVWSVSVRLALASPRARSGSCDRPDRRFRRRCR